MMDDVISRQAAIEKTDMLFKELSKDYVDMMGIGYNHAVGDAIAILKGLQSAERHGHWEKVNDNPYEYVAACSVCRNEVKQPTCMLKPIYSYCPICGAKMDEVEDNG